MYPIIIVFHYQLVPSDEKLGFRVTWWASLLFICWLSYGGGGNGFQCMAQYSRTYIQYCNVGSSRVCVCVCSCVNACVRVSVCAF